MKCLTERMPNWLLIPGVHSPGNVGLRWIWSGPRTGAGDGPGPVAVTRIGAAGLDGDGHHALLLLFTRVGQTEAQILLRLGRWRGGGGLQFNILIFCHENICF